MYEKCTMNHEDQEVIIMKNFFYNGNIKSNVKLIREIE